VESGRKVDRPELAKALAEARRLGAAVAVAKLDRIARDAELVLRLAREADRNGFGGLLFADLPEVDATTAAGRMVLTVMASVAEYEGRRIAERTREALIIDPVDEQIERDLAFLREHGLKLVWRWKRTPTPITSPARANWPNSRVPKPQRPRAAASAPRRCS
jgi:hypothetical protein